MGTEGLIAPYNYSVIGNLEKGRYLVRSIDDLLRHVRATLL